MYTKKLKEGCIYLFRLTFTISLDDSIVLFSGLVYLTEPHVTLSYPSSHIFLSLFATYPQQNFPPN